MVDVRWVHADHQTFDTPEDLRASADLVVTSPPYKTADGYSPTLMRKLAETIDDILKPGGLAFVNFAQLAEGLDRPSEVQWILGERLRVGQTIVWVKSVVVDGHQRGHFQPLNSKHLLNYCWEYVFTFYKTPRRQFDRLSVGVPYADKSNLKRGTRGKNGDVHCAGDVWFLPYSTTGASAKKSHRHEFPEQLVERCLKVAGAKPGETVFEPFCGGGTTPLVASRMGLNSIVIDADLDALATAKDRLSKSGV